MSDKIHLQKKERAGNRRRDLIFAKTASITDLLEEFTSGSIFHHDGQMLRRQKDLQTSIIKVGPIVFLARILTQCIEASKMDYIGKLVKFFCNSNIASFKYQTFKPPYKCHQFFGGINLYWRSDSQQQWRAFISSFSIYLVAKVGWSRWGPKMILDFFSCFIIIIIICGRQKLGNLYNKD